MTETRSSAGLPCLVVLATAACASTSTHGDFRRVSTLAEQRAELKLVERAPEKFEQPEADVGRLLARPLDADAAVRVALLNNRELRASCAKWASRAASLIQAGLLPNPGSRWSYSPRESQVELRAGRSARHSTSRARCCPARSSAAAARPRCQRATELAGSRRRPRLPGRVSRSTACNPRSQLVELRSRHLDGTCRRLWDGRRMSQAGNISRARSSRARRRPTRRRASPWCSRARSGPTGLARALNVCSASTASSTTLEVERAPDPAREPSSPADSKRDAHRASLELARERERELDRAGARAAGSPRREGMASGPERRRARRRTRWRMGGRARVAGTCRCSIASRAATCARGRVRGARASATSPPPSRSARQRERRASRLRVGARTRAAVPHIIVLPLRARVVDETLLQYNAMQVGVFQLLRRAATARRELRVRRDAARVLDRRAPRSTRCSPASRDRPRWRGRGGADTRSARAAGGGTDMEDTALNRRDFIAVGALLRPAALLARGAERARRRRPRRSADAQPRAARRRGRRPATRRSPGRTGGRGHAQRLDAAVDASCDGVKVFHLVAERSSTSSRPGLTRDVLGLQRPHARPDDRGGRGRPRAHLRDQPAARADHACTGTASSCRTAWTASAGLTQQPIPPGETFKYEFTLRAARHVHVPPALRRDDADGARHDGHVRRPSARARAGRASIATSR